MGNITKLKMFTSMPLIQLVALSALLLISGCKSDVEEKPKLNTENVIIIDTFRAVLQTDITENQVRGALITHKNYAITMCLSENALGRPLDRRPVRVKGVTLNDNGTATSGGCIYWEQKIAFSYDPNDRCQVFESEIHLTDSNVKRRFRYSIDLLENTIADLDRSEGCTGLQKASEQNIEEAAKNSEEEERRVLRTQNILALKTITGNFVQIRGIDTEVARSDVRQLYYDSKISTCITTQLDDRPLKNTKIEVQIDEQIITDETINDGCFEVYVRLKYDQYHYSEWLQKDLKVKITSGPLMGTEIQREFYINPWEPKSRAYILDTESADEVKDGMLANTNPKYNRISIDGVMYILIGNDLENFKVNDYLNLTVSKTYQVVLTPRIDRGHRSSYSPDQRYEKMHDGKFRLKFMILAPNHSEMEITEDNYKNFTYLTGAEKEVTVKDGIINEQIDIPVRMSDMPRLATRTVTIFKLEPLEDTGLRNTVVTGFFKAKIPWIKTNVFSDKALEDNSFVNDNSPSEIQEMARKAIQDKLDNNQFDAENLESEVLDTSNFRQLDTGSPDFMADVKKANYKEAIDKLFNNISNYRNNVIFGKRSDLVSDDSSEIYFKHLQHLFDNIVTGKAFTYDDVEVLSEEEARETQSSQTLSLSDGEINQLYEYTYHTDSDLLNNQTYMKMADHICKQAFAGKEERARWFHLRKSNPDLDRCLKKPYKYFDINRTMHIAKVHDTKPKYSQPINLQIGSYFTAGDYRSQYTWESHRVGADIGLKLPLGNLFSSGVRLYEYSRGKAENTGTNINSTDNVGLSLQVMVEKFVVGVTGTFKSCVTFSGKKYLPESIRNRVESSQSLNSKNIGEENLEHAYVMMDKAFYYCDSSAVEKEIDESWYYLQAYTPQTNILADPFGPTEVKFIKVIRGDENFAQLKKILEDKTRSYIITNTSNTSTPLQKLFSDWGHLLTREVDPATSNRLAIKGFDDEDMSHITRDEGNNAHDENGVYDLTFKRFEDFESAFPGTINRNVERDNAISTWTRE